MKKMNCNRFAAFPKVELHLHLEGAVRRQTLKELAKKKGLENPHLEDVINGKIDRYDGLHHFLTTMRAIGDTCLQNPEDYERISKELFEDLAEQNVVYAEVSYDPLRGLRLGIPIDEIFAAVYAAKQEVEKTTDIKIGLIIGLGRERGAEIVTDFTKKAIDARALGIIGLDLHGDEEASPPEEFTVAYDLARNAGLGLRAHAGEASGAKSVWGAVLALGVSRIAHGIRAVDDPKLMEYLRDHHITLDICPSSNYMLGLVQAFPAHPIRQLFDFGIPVSISTDDPLYFNTNMNQEYCILTEHLNFTVEELKQINLHAIEGAFLDESDKQSLKDKIERSYR